MKQPASSLVSSTKQTGCTVISRHRKQKRIPKSKLKEQHLFFFSLAPPFPASKLWGAAHLVPIALDISIYREKSQKRDETPQSIAI